VEALVTEMVDHFHDAAGAAECDLDLDDRHRRCFGRERIRGGRLRVHQSGQRNRT
jgi:hypothetical protein